MRSKSDKAEFARRKQEVQVILWEKLGLRVDKPKAGGSGTTNDGNTARRAFEHPDSFADYLGLNRQLVRNFKTILIALSCEFPINPVCFDTLCTSTAQIYVARYSWYPMSSTLHKILIHAPEIISFHMLPVGMLGEEASEARNKDYKKYRQGHSRKHSRKANLEDIFYRAMDTSDPIISTVGLQKRIQNRRRLSFLPEVTELFAIPEADTISSCHAEDEASDEVSSGLQETLLFLSDVELSDED
ncbi:dna-mediated transposase [Lasius niger]|uniref:Dna-mediated transposase n=2 Tax=Lasius niger TaxID=67767 RepID=A0A0J7KFV0_LASNI|nr:dna-mediated transposase [Lasius niger]